MSFGIVMAVISAVSAAASTYASVQQQDAQNEAIEKQTRQRNLELLEQQGQANDQAAIEKFEARRNAMRREAMVKVQGAEGGALGNSFSRSLVEADIDEMIDISYIDKNVSNKKANTELGLDAAHTKAESSMGEINMGAAALQIGSSAASSYVQGKQASGEKMPWEEGGSI